jgi:glycosyltransferase involved in cell wall biosynthesis
VSPKVIVHVLGGMAAGGVERLCLQLLRHRPVGVRQVLINIGPPGGSLEELFRGLPDLSMEHEPYSRTRRFAFVANLARRLRRWRPAGVISYPFGLHVLVGLAAKVVPSCRLIVHVGNPPPPGGPRRLLFRRLVTASRWLRTPLWSCSQAVHQELVALGSPMPKDSAVVPNGVDTASLQAAAAAARSNRRQPGLTVGMVGRLDRIKDQKTLLTAFKEVRRHRPDARLWLIGDGDLRAALEQHAREIGVDESAVFWGARKDVGDLLGRIDMFAFSTTRNEGFGIALAEAMAVGLPIVASDVAACREVLAGGLCGLLVPPEDPAAFATAILDMLADPDRQRRLADAAKARAEREYGIASCARRYYDYLLSVTDMDAEDRYQSAASIREPVDLRIVKPSTTRRSGSWA